MALTSHSFNVVSPSYQNSSLSLLLNIQPKLKKNSFAVTVGSPPAEVVLCCENSKDNSSLAAQQQ